MSEQPKKLPDMLEQRVRRLAFRFADNDEAYDWVVEVLTLLVSEALDYHKTSVETVMASMLARGAREQADKLEALRKAKEPSP